MLSGVVSIWCWASFLVCDYIVVWWHTGSKLPEDKVRKVSLNICRIEKECIVPS